MSAQQPTAFPDQEADLAPWRIHADALQAAGDPLGELMGVELALPARPSDEQLAGWLKRVQALCHEPEPRARVGWCLGHARVLAFDSDPALSAPGARPWATSLGSFLATPQAAWLERLELDLAPSVAARASAEYRRMLQALPPRCQAVHLKFRNHDEGSLALTLEALPATVRELSVAVTVPGAIRLALSDRFELVRLSGRLPAELFAEVAEQLDRTEAVKLSVETNFLTAEQMSPLRDRLALCRPGEAALVDPRAGLFAPIPRWSLLDLTQRLGPIAWRTWASQAYPQPYAVLGGDDWLGVMAGYAADLTRAPDGSWSLKGGQGPSQRIRVGDRWAGREGIELRPLEPFFIHTPKGDFEWLLVTDDVEAWYRARFFT